MCHNIVILEFLFRYLSNKTFWNSMSAWMPGPLSADYRAPQSSLPFAHLWSWTHSFEEHWFRSKSLPLCRFTAHRPSRSLSLTGLWIEESSLQHAFSLVRDSWPSACVCACVSVRKCARVWAEGVALVCFCLLFSQTKEERIRRFWSAHLLFKQVIHFS